MPKKFEVISKPTSSKEYNISIWDSIEDYEDYDDLRKALDEISKKDKVTLNVFTPGGRCDIGFDLYHRIKALECTVDVVVPYPTYSMGAILALSGDSLKVLPGAYLMFHDYSGGAKGKGNEMYKQTAAYMEAFACMFNNICQPFLTKKECADILEGKDLYVKWNDIEDRVKRHFKEK